MLIRAFSIIHKQIPDVTFEIYGDGELREDLELLVDSEGLTNCVVFCGFCGDAVQRIASSSVYVMASNWEGLSNSLIEALAMGVPSVCTRCLGGGAEAVVEDGVNGYLVDRDDHEVMAQRVVELLLDPVLRDPCLRKRQNWLMNFHLRQSAKNGRKLCSLRVRYNERLNFRKWRDPFRPFSWCCMAVCANLPLSSNARQYICLHKGWDMV